MITKTDMKITIYEIAWSQNLKTEITDQKTHF